MLRLFLTLLALTLLSNGCAKKVIRQSPEKTQIERSQKAFEELERVR